VTGPERALDMESCRTFLHLGLLLASAGGKARAFILVSLVLAKSQWLAAEGPSMLSNEIDGDSAHRTGRDCEKGLLPMDCGST